MLIPCNLLYSHLPAHRTSSHGQRSQRCPLMAFLNSWGCLQREFVPDSVGVWRAGWEPLTCSQLLLIFMKSSWCGEWPLNSFYCLGSKRGKEHLEQYVPKQGQYTACSLWSFFWYSCLLGFVFCSLLLNCLKDFAVTDVLAQLPPATP